MHCGPNFGELTALGSLPPEGRSLAPPHTTATSEQEGGPFHASGRVLY
jgi:hypothetical protein